MSHIFSWLFLASLIFGVVCGNLPAVSAAMPMGAGLGVELVLKIGGTICVWQGVMEVMDRSGLSKIVARSLFPIIYILFGKYAKNGELAAEISQNMSANLLGLGSAATPAGLKAANRLAKISGSPVSDAVLKLIILNTASVQLIPTNVAAVRAAAGAQNPFEILPAVWVASVCSVAAALFAAKIFSGLKK